MDKKSGRGLTKPSTSKQTQKPLRTSSANILIFQAMIDQKNRPIVIDDRDDFQDEFTNKMVSTLKPLYFMLCPAYTDVFMLEELKWSTTLPNLLFRSLRLRSGS